MFNKIFTITLLCLVFLISYVNAQNTVQAGISLSGTSLIISAKPNNDLSAFVTGGNITITWSTAYGVTLSSPTNSIGNWTLNDFGISGSDNYANYANTSGSFPINWTSGSTYELFRVSVSQTGNGTGTFNLDNTIDGGWYFEAGADYTNYVTPFYSSSVSNVPLPVELTLFNATLVNNSNVELEWQTATEVNNYGFEIQRSAASGRQLATASAESRTLNADSWGTIGFVKGSGNSNSPKNYSYTDDAIASSGKRLYRMKQIDFDGGFKYSKEVEVEVKLPKEYALLQNFPNPFNPATAINYHLAEDSHVSLIVYNILGEKVRTLVNEYEKAGAYVVYFDASGLASGVYIYKLVVTDKSRLSAKFARVKKMIVLK